MRIALTILLSLASLCLAQAQETGRSFTFDFGADAPKPMLPSWMPGEPVASPATHATISFPIDPPPGDSDLAITVDFTETMGGFLRVYWAGVGDNGMLSDNLFEGIGMPNQRTILVRRATLASPGTVNFQSSEPSLNISRIRWEWVAPTTIALSKAANQTALVDATGGVLTDEQVNGGPLLPKPDNVLESVVTATLTDKPERIEAGVEFVATLQQAPQYARLEVQMAGVPVGKDVKLWINRGTAAEVSLAVPDLNDPGFVAATSSQPDAQAAPVAPVYFGWRKGVLYVPGSVLKSGENSFQFAVDDVTASTPIAVKDMVLQLKYADAPAYQTAAAVGAASAADQAPAAGEVPVPDPAPAVFPKLIATPPDLSPIELTPAPASSPSPSPVKKGVPPGRG